VSGFNLSAKRDFILKLQILALGLFTALASSSIAEEFNTLVVVRELDQVNVPAQQDGLISELFVRRGHSVEARQIISELDKTDINLKLSVAESELTQLKAKAENDGPVEAAETAVRRAEKEDQLLSELGKNAVYLELFRTRNNFEKATADLKSARNQLLQDSLQVDVKKNQLKQLEYDLKRNTVRSPYDGVVNELLKQKGEWVRQGDPVVKITRMDKLLVEGFLDSTKVSPDSVVGATAKVTLQARQGSQTQFDGLVVEHPAPKLELDGKFPVWVEIKNRQVEDRNSKKQWLIRPGMNGTMTVSIE
jgi:multidrug resistance efflux pump